MNKIPISRARRGIDRVSQRKRAMTRAGRSAAARPHLIDLNMPRKRRARGASGNQERPASPHHSVVVLTPRRRTKTLYRSYDLGVNSTIVKPVNLRGASRMLQTLEKVLVEDRGAAAEEEVSRLAGAGDQSAERWLISRC